jgi:hypothetical protein
MPFFSCAFSLLLILSITALGISIYIHFQPSYFQLLDRETFEQLGSLQAPSLSWVATLIGGLAILLLLSYRACCKRHRRQCLWMGCTAVLFLGCIVVELYVNINLFQSSTCQDDYVCSEGIGAWLSLGTLLLWILSFILSVLIPVCCQSRTYTPVSHDQIEMSSTSTSEKSFVRPIMDGGFAWDGKLEHVIPIDAIPCDEDDEEDLL